MVTLKNKLQQSVGYVNFEMEEAYGEVFISVERFDKEGNEEEERSSYFSIKKNDLESLIGSLLHLQAKLRKQYSEFDKLSNSF
jgi:hypothetical protein